MCAEYTLAYVVARGGLIRYANRDAEGALQGEDRAKAVRINRSTDTRIFRALMVNFVLIYRIATRAFVARNASLRITMLG